MTAITRGQLTHRLISGTTLLGLAILLNFHTQAQDSQSKTENKKQSGTPTHGQSHTVIGAEQMDAVTRAKLEKAQQQLEKAQQQLMKQDWTLIEAEMVQAKAQLEKAIRSTEFDFAKVEMEKAMVEMEKSLAAQQGKLAVEMKKADAEMKRVQAELELMQQGMELMEKDGLIKPGASINMDWEEDILIINGQRQTKEVSDKYRKYFKKQKVINKKTEV